MRHFWAIIAWFVLAGCATKVDCQWRSTNGPGSGVTNQIAMPVSTLWVTSQEVAATGINWTFAPCIAAQPGWRGNVLLS
jgi:hypothetical protein